MSRRTAAPALVRLVMAAAVIGALLTPLLVSPRPVAAQEVIGIAVGEAPEPVQIEDLDGNPVDLGDYIGRRPVLIEFWATWCPLCDALQPRVDAAHKRYGDRVDFLLIGVAVNQTQRSIRRHMERHGMAGTMLYDARGAAVRAFRAPSTSYVVVLGADGRVAYTGIGADQDIEAAITRALRAGEY